VHDTVFPYHTTETEIAYQLTPADNPNAQAIQDELKDIDSQ
ncbi:hypothetical protein ACLBQX_25560, partial [Klebsiella pneumoniae]